MQTVAKLRSNFQNIKALQPVCHVRPTGFLFDIKRDSKLRQCVFVWPWVSVCVCEIEKHEFNLLRRFHRARTTRFVGRQGFVCRPVLSSVLIFLLSPLSHFKSTFIKTFELFSPSSFAIQFGFAIQLYFRVLPFIPVQSSMQFCHLFSNLCLW